MSQKVGPIREGFHNLTPCLVVNDANKAIEFYTKVFGEKKIIAIIHPTTKA